MDFEEFLKVAELTNKRSHGELVARFIVDIKRMRWYAVPSGINHPEYVAKKFKMKIKDIEANPENVSHLIGVAVGIENNEIASVLTGISGLETWLKTVKNPVHNKNDVNTAHVFILDILRKVGAIFSSRFKDRVVYL